MTVRELKIEVKEKGQTHYKERTTLTGSNEKELLMLQQIYVGDMHASLNKFKGYGSFSAKCNYDGTYTYTLTVKAHDYAGQVVSYCRKTYIISTSDAV